MYQYTDYQEGAHFFYCFGRAYLELLVSDINKNNIEFHNQYAILKIYNTNGFSFRKQSRYYLYFQDAKISKKYLLEEWDGDDYTPVYQEIEYYNDLPHVDEIKDRNMVKYMNEEYRAPSEPDSDQFYNSRGELVFPWDSNSDADYASASSTSDESEDTEHESEYELEEFNECYQDLGHGRLVV